MAVRTWVVGMAVAVFACGESSTGDDDPAARGGAAGESSGGALGGSVATGGRGATGGTLGAGGMGASGGSLATGGSVATGGSITTAGSGGASAGSPNGGSPGKSNYGNPLPEDPRCAAFATRVAEACPGDWTYAESHLFCQDKLNELSPMGCGTEFGEFVTCEGETNCNLGLSQSCTDAYRDCSSGFVADTVCVREGAGITCPEGSFAFICRLDTPDTCTPTETVGSATRACCPPFGTNSRG